MYGNLRAEIARKGWSLGRFAEELDMGRNTLTTKMSGQRSFSLDEAKKAKEVLGTELPLEELFERTR